jgi:SIR2-like protein
MNYADTVRELASILNPQNEARPTVLLGAGASFSSGVPLADESVKRIARRYYAERVSGKALPEQVKTSEWMAWLAERPWFIRDPARLPENFPLAVKHLLTPQAYRQKVLLDLIAPEAEIGPGYRHLAELVLRGLVGTILTTNFDICLPRALNDKRPHIRHVAEVNRGPDDFREFDIFNRAQIVWLHGKAEQYTDKNLTEEVQQLDPKLVGVLLPLLQSTPLIVVGYRGAEPSIMKSLLGEGGDLAFKKGIFWCHRGGDLHPNVKAFQQRLGSNFKLCETDGFDELFGDLNKKLARQQEAWARRRSQNRGTSTIARSKAQRWRISIWISPCARPTNTRASSDFGSRPPRR